MKKLLLASALIAAGVATGFAQSNVITAWTFEVSFPAFTNTNGAATVTGSISPNFAAEIGSGTASGVHSNAVTTWSGPAGNGTLRALSANTWTVGDYYQFASSTTGFTNIGVSWGQTGSATGPRDFAFSYSLDGSAFTPVTNYSLANLSWNTNTFNPTNTFNVDLSSVLALNNASTVFFRLTDVSTTAINGGTVGTGGTGRVDDFTIYEFTAVPEPAALALVAVGAVGLLVRQYRRRR